VKVTVTYSFNFILIPNKLPFVTGLPSPLTMTSSSQMVIFQELNTLTPWLPAIFCFAKLSALQAC